MNRIGIVSAVAAVITACAYQGVAPTVQQQLAERGYVVGEEVRDIQNYRVDGWNHLDSRHLIINTGPSERYLLSLRIDCHALSSSEDIGFTHTAGRLTRFDSVILQDTAGLRRDCPIDRIEKLQAAPQ